MKNAVLLFPLLLLMSRAAYAAESDFVIDAKNGNVGFINKNTTYEDIIAKKIPKNDSAVGVGEGFCRYATILAPNTPREVYVYWKSFQENFDCNKAEQPDLKKSGTVDYILISRKDSVWKTTDGIKIGSSLADLEKTYKGAVGFKGFEWDYGGICCENNKNFPKALSLTLEAILAKKDDAKLNEYYINNMVGDRAVMSDSIPKSEKEKIKISVQRVMFDFTKQD